MSEFPDGFAVVYDGQEYRPVRTIPYTTKAGMQTTIVYWETECPRCGITFEISTRLKAGVSRSNRRCDDCKAPGVPVRRHLTRQVKSVSL